jgi:hypothetical protein
MEFCNLLSRILCIVLAKNRARAQHNNYFALAMWVILQC